MATNRITYGQSAIAVSQPPANSDNTSNLTGLKRVQSASIDFTFARERFKQLGSPDYVGQVQIRNADIGFGVNYFYSNGTNEAMMGLNVDGNSGTALKYVKKENQDRNYYLLMGTGDSAEPNMLDSAGKFKNQFNIMALGNVFLDSYSLSASLGSPVAVSTDLSAYNIVMNEYNDSTNVETIPAINTLQTSPDSPAQGTPVLDKKYKITPSVFQNTTNRDGNIIAAFAPGDIELILADVKEPGLQFTGSNPVRSASLESFDVGFNIDRTDLYGLGSMYPYGRRAVLPILGNLSFSALATEFTSGNLSSFLSGVNNYNFTINLKDHCSGQTGLQMVVENAQMDNQGLSDTLGSNASMTASFGFSMSDTSGLKFSTQPLMVLQPPATAAGDDTIYVQATGQTASRPIDTSFYNPDGFKYEWYRDIDPAFAKLMIHGNVGVGQSIVDSSLSNHAITAGGSVTHSTTESKFAGGSIFFDGATDYLEMGSSSDWVWGTDDWTVDFWMWASSQANRPIFEFGVWNVDGFVLRTNQSGSDKLSLYVGGTLYEWPFPAATYANSAWHHIAIVRETSISIRVYVDGISLGYNAIPAGTTITNDGGVARIGTVLPTSPATFPWDGYLDEFRVTKGRALWIRDFAPPRRRDTLANIPLGFNRKDLYLPFSSETYYAVISNELGSTTTNNCVVP